MSIQNALGTIHHDAPSTRKTDYLYRISLKCLVKNEKGEVLVVKESGRDWWDLPGGGMDHGETLQETIAREMHEEVMLKGDFTYQIIATDEPAHLSNHNFWQLRLVFSLQPDNLTFSPGDDGDEVTFKDPAVFQQSSSATERRIYTYSQIELGE